MNSKKRLFQNSIIYFIGNFATKILSFFMLPLYTRYLNPTDYGDFDTVQSLTTLLVPIIFIQISDAVIRMLLEATEKEERTKYVSNAFAVLIVGTLVAAIVIPIICYVSKYHYLILFYIYFILHAWHIVIQQMVRSLGYTKLYALGGVVSTITTVGLNLIFILGFKMKASALFLSAIGTSLVLCLIMFFGAKIYRYVSFKALNRSAIGEMARYCIPLIPNTLSWQMITTFSKLYLRYACGSDTQGLFAVANRFPNLITMITGIFYLAWQEIGIIVFNTSEKDQTYTEIYNYYIRCLFAGMIVLLPVSKLYVLYALSANYREIWIYIPIMVFSASISALNSFLGTAYLGKKSTKNVMYTSLIAGAVNVVAVLLLTKSLGIWGVAIGGLLSYLTLLIIRTVDVKKYVTIQVDKTDLIKFFLCFAAISVAYYLLSGKIANAVLLLGAVIVGLYVAFPIIKSILRYMKEKIAK